MINHRYSKQAEKILALQKEDGSWGKFHSLSIGEVCTTEGALRRLMILGYTVEDECLHRAAEYLVHCLEVGEIPDRREKTHNWDIFVEMMLSSWLCRLQVQSPKAERIAQKWAIILTGAFQSGEYSADSYASAYEAVFAEKPRGGRILDFVQPYILTLASGRLDERTESAVFDYVLQHKPGIYYICDGELLHPPQDFCSREASRYLGAMELLAMYYPRQRKKLAFVRDWLHENQAANGCWDMGCVVKDNVYFPLSDDWRRKGAREMDCTERVQNLLHMLED
ncbi:MAG: hypothetical protein J6C51_09320 [Clostridia bacterium]|nr:hypothetical protein [Clostridia bacterium]